jgi:hypothetical protein
MPFAIGGIRPTMDFKWVAQVSLLRPGFLLAGGSRPEHPLNIRPRQFHLHRSAAGPSVFDALFSGKDEASTGEPANS